MFRNVQVRKITSCLVFSLLFVLLASVSAHSATFSYQFTPTITGNGEAYFNIGPKLEFFHGTGYDRYNEPCKITSGKTYKFSKALSRGIAVNPHRNSYFKGFYDSKGSKVALKSSEVDIIRVTINGVYFFDCYPSYNSDNFPRLSQTAYNLLVKEYVKTVYGVSRYVRLGSETIYNLKSSDQKLTLKFKPKSSPITMPDAPVTKTLGDGNFKLQSTVPSGVTFLYSSSNSRVASINKKNGEITLNGCGICKITIRNASTPRYLADKRVIKINVKPKQVKWCNAAKNASPRFIKVSWSKDETASGFEVAISKDSSFKNPLLLRNIASGKTSSKEITLSKALHEKASYVRIRAYKRSCNETLYGKYQTVKIK